MLAFITRHGRQPPGTDGAARDAEAEVRGDHNDRVGAGLQRQHSAGATAVPGDVREDEGVSAGVHRGAGGRAKAGTGGRALACCPGLIDTGFHQVAGIDVAGIPFPVMPPAEVARAALAGLRLGEVVCVPGLGDQSMVGNVNDAQGALFTTAVSFRARRR